MPLFLMIWLAAATVVVPKNVILVKGAAPAASDAATPVPEDGSTADGRYRNAYFGLSYPIPAGWTEQPAGPPPSDRGIYVLAQFALVTPELTRAHVQITARDLFFGAAAVSAHEISALYQLERGANAVTIAGRTFQRLAYGSPRTGLHWRMLTTEVRCHALTFTFTGSDVAALDAAEKSLRGLTLAGNGPRCVSGYAQANALDNSAPEFQQRYNTIPVRLIIDTEGKVKHVHILSAFPEQAQPILDAVRTWRFKPYVADGKAMEVESGMIFGAPSLSDAARAGTDTSAAVPRPTHTQPRSR